MTLSNISSVFLLSLFVLLSVSCNQKARLPKEMPAATEMKYSRSKGRGTPAGSVFIQIKGSQIIIEENGQTNDERNKFEAEISKEDKEKLYKVFVENDFNSIESEEKATDHDSETVSISANGLSHSVSNGSQYTFKDNNHLERFNRVAQAIQAISNQYKDKAKIINNDKK